MGLSKIIGGLSNGLELVAEKTGNTLKNMSKDLAISSTKVFHRVGDLGLTVSRQLGNVVEIVPILGKPTAFVVKGAGRGVYYVVTTVGNVTGKSIKTVGRIGEQVADIVVFTIVSTSNLTEKTLKETGNVVKRITHLVNGRKTHKHRKGKGSKKRRRGSSKRRRGRSSKRRRGRSSKRRRRGSSKRRRAIECSNINSYYPDSSLYINLFTVDKFIWKIKQKNLRNL